MVGWRLVTLIREFCDRKFSVLVPYKSLSCATLISLGANEIIMGKMGQLSPIDPSVTTPFNPSFNVASGQRGNLLPVNVEDVIAYLKLAKDEGDLKRSEQLVSVFADLTKNIHPITLGSVYKARLQIKMLAENLLKMHMKRASKSNLESIIKPFTEELYSHDYLINRREAKQKIGLNTVKYPDDELESLMWDLYKEYETLMELNDIFNPSVFLGTEEERELVANRAIIESAKLRHVFRTRKNIRRHEPVAAAPAPVGRVAPQDIFEERLIQEGWEKENAAAES